MMLYGKTISHDGYTHSVQGYATQLHADTAAYKMAIGAGYDPGPLREKWWQFWRPTSYPPGYVIALYEENPNDQALFEAASKVRAETSE